MNLKLAVSALTCGACNGPQDGWVFMSRWKDKAALARGVSSQKHGACFAK